MFMEYKNANREKFTLGLKSKLSITETNLVRKTHNIIVTISARKS